MISTVAHVRLSSDKRKASLKRQKEEFEQLTKREDYRIIRWYIDKTVSSDATEKRVRF